MSAEFVCDAGLFCIWATLVQVVEQVVLQDPWVLTPEFTPKCVCVRKCKKVLRYR